MSGIEQCPPGVNFSITVQGVVVPYLIQSQSIQSDDRTYQQSRVATKGFSAREGYTIRRPSLNSLAFALGIRSPVSGSEVVVRGVEIFFAPKLWV
jgi:hypothetical protein